MCIVHVSSCMCMCRPACACAIVHVLSCMCIVHVSSCMSMCLHVHALVSSCMRRHAWHRAYACACVILHVSSCMCMCHRACACACVIHSSCMCMCMLHPVCACACVHVIVHVHLSSCRAGGGGGTLDGCLCWFKLPHTHSLDFKMCACIEIHSGIVSRTMNIPLVPWPLAA